ncbi:HAMP domain-containing sensor histidine kinase [Clavibacter michiganensis]|uniref:sensor histidine kinase n=2 Tax=Clavibacter michiganensis TaxID=28447 RepID=UPI0026DB1F9D|nr:HAMP domain-containing sensor histidine kinase [Clavibacter michiganensis]MDO4075361.1 HAMP domain-containing sensor histidine kinase [Clavibacter michiganensis]
MSAITRARRLVPGRQAATAPDAPLRTGSLRTRTVLAVLALLAVLLVALSLTVQAILGAQLRQQIQDRLADRASAAAALVGVLDDDALAERLSAQGVAVQITSPDGGAVSVRPGRDPLGATLPGPDPLGEAPGSGSVSTPATPRADAVTVASSSVSSSAGGITLRSDLSDGTVLELSAGTGSVDGTLASLRGILAVASVGFLLLAAVALVVVVRRTLQPLEDMTGVARSIGRGDRGRRLRPTRPATELGRTATAFDEMLDDLEHAEHQALAAEARMRAFVADAAHELRTPVAGIRASADALVRTDPSAEERERLAVHVVREAIRAGRLVDDMLMMARLDEGLSVEGRPMRVPPVVEAAVAQQRARTPGTRVVADVRGAPPAVRADPDRLAQILDNLLQNAARYASSEVRVEAEGADDGSVRITVADDGPGVPDADRERIFDRLVRLDDGRDRQHGGAGLGLSIARALARAQGGDLVCLPAVTGVGARFLLTLPVVDAGY